MRTNPILALALLAGTSALQAAIVFDVTTTSVTPTLAASFGLFGVNTIASTPLPTSNGITGFKIAGSAAAENKGSTICTTCELTVRAGGNLSSSGFGTVLPAPVPVSWSFRVDEVSTPGIKDGTSNTISLENTLPPTRTRLPENGGITDGTSNTIIFGESLPTESRNFLYRLFIIYGSSTGAPSPITDGNSNTIIFGETTTQQIASGNGYYGDEILGAGSFNLQNRFGLFTLELHILPTGLGVDRGILLTIPQNSIDLNPPNSVPEPSAIALTFAGLAVLALRRKQR